MSHEHQTPLHTLFVGTDKYVRTVIVVELREAGYLCTVVEDIERAKRQLDGDIDFDILLLISPHDRNPLLKEASVLTEFIPKNRIGILSEHCDLLILSGKYDGYSVIDRDVSTLAIFGAIEAMVQGTAVVINADLRHSRLQNVLRKMDQASSREAVGAVLQKHYAEIMSEPLPADLSEKIAKLDTPRS